MDSPPPKKHRMEVEQDQPWMKIRADSYEATVSVASVMQYPSSYLAGQLELAQRSPDPAVRLNCDADEAREIEAVLRQVRAVLHGMGHALAYQAALLAGPV